MKTRHVDYFVYGTQYYRPPTPPVDEFEEDFKRIKTMNMNTTKIWAQWRWMERKKEEYRFEELDRLFELGQKNDIKILVNIVLDTPPAWLYREHPDCLIVNLDGTSVMPSTYVGSRMIGGYQPCFDHPAVRENAERLIDKTIRKYRDSPVLLGWDVWNEPRMPACRCNYTVAKYRNWLMRHYPDIEAFNDAWGKSYGYWEDIEPPVETKVPVYGSDRSDLSGMLCFGQFLLENLSDQIKWIADFVHERDPAHIVATHHGSEMDLLASPVGGEGHDQRYVSRHADVYGSTVHLMYYEGYALTHDPKVYCKYPMALDNVRSAKQEYWVAEISSDALTPPLSGLGKMLPGEMISNLLTGVAHGAKGIVFWQFKPERYGAESPGWGLVNYDGSLPPRAEEAKEFGKILKKHEDIMLNAKPYPAEVGIYYDRRINILNYCFGGKWFEAVHGAYYGFWIENIPVETVVPEDEWSRFKAIYMPFPILVDEQVSEKVERFVKNGGTVIAEAALGKYRGNAFHSLTVPGEGLHEVFQVVERETEPCKSTVMKAVKDTIPGFNTGSKAEGSYRRATLQVGDAETLALFDTGEPAVCLRRYKRGNAVYVGTYPSVRLSETGDRQTARMTSGLSKLADITVPVKVLSPTGSPIVTCVLERDDAKILFLFSHSGQEENVTLQTNWKPNEVNLIYGKEPELLNRGLMRFQMPPRGVNVLYTR